MVGVDVHAFIDMAQRQVAQRLAGFVDGEDVLYVEDIAQQVVVRKHHPFRETGGAGGVYEGGYIVPVDAVFKRLQHFRVGVFLSQLDQFAEVLHVGDMLEGVKPLYPWYLRHNMLDLSEQVPARDKYILHLGMVEYIFIIRFTDGGIDGDMYGADLQDGHVHEVPLRAVAGDGGDLVSLFYSKL